MTIIQFLQRINYPLSSYQSLVSMQINHKIRKPWTLNEKKNSFVYLLQISITTNKCAPQ